MMVMMLMTGMEVSPRRGRLLLPFSADWLNGLADLVVDDYYWLNGAGEGWIVRKEVETKPGPSLGNSLRRHSMRPSAAVAMSLGLRLAQGFKFGTNHRSWEKNLLVCMYIWNAPCTLTLNIQY